MDDRFLQQLKKGVLEMLVLDAVCRGSTYGYELLTGLKTRSDALFALKEGTLYPILYRLEDEELIQSSWSQGEGRMAPKKMYTATEKGRQIFITGHSEYDADTLKNEYLRDKNAGLPIEIPKNYFPDDDDTREPIVRWRSCANLFYSNWLNYFVYQSTPYNIDEIDDK